MESREDSVRKTLRVGRLILIDPQLKKRWKESSNNRKIIKKTKWKKQTSTTTDLRLGKCIQITSGDATLLVSVFSDSSNFPAIQKLLTLSISPTLDEEVWVVVPHMTLDNPPHELAFALSWHKVHFFTIDSMHLTPNNLNTKTVLWLFCYVIEGDDIFTFFAQEAPKHVQVTVLSSCLYGTPCTQYKKNSFARGFLHF